MDSYQSAKEEIKRVADIVELIGQFIHLKRSGQNHIGLCPFHSEKDPSFTVSASKQMFHCFGCKKGGDIFEFWMEYHKVSFPQALRDLAERYHVSLPEKRLSPSEKKRITIKEFLIRVNEIAAEYYHQILTKSEKGKPGRAYLHKRSFSNEIISEFMLGYAPDTWDGLTNFLRNKKMDMEKAVQAGLIIPKKNGGHYDRFRGRVLFPIFNLRNQIVGFGARVLNDSLPKYINTPETPIFRKGELLYGLNAAYKPIRESGRAVVVEGYTDVLALRMHGFHEAVATLGTALTKDHIRKLKGYAKEVVIVFDADTAGKLAAMKSFSIFLNEGLASRVMVLPEDEDPDSFIHKRGLDGFINLLSQSSPMFDFYLHQKLINSSDSIEGKVSILEEIIPVLSEIENKAQCSLYVRRLSEKMDIAETTLLAELKKYRSRPSLKSMRTGLRERLSTSRPEKIDDYHLLNLFIHYPHSMEKLMDLDCKVLLSDQTVIGLLDSIYEIYTRQGKLKPEDILERLDGDTGKELFREVILSPPIYDNEMVDQAIKEFEEKIQKIRLSESIKKARESGDIQGLNQILKLKSTRRLHRARS